MADELLETYVADDPVAENNVRRDAERIARQDTDVLAKIVMKDAPGRAWLHRLLSKCHIFGETFHGEETHLSAFSQGQENIGKQIMLSAQEASVDLYLLMVKEARAEEKRLEDVRRKEERDRAQAEEPTTDSEFMPDLPPPAGYPGGPDLPTSKNKDKRK